MTTEFDRWAHEFAEGTEVVTRVCVCGHDEADHPDHYRAGSECLACGCMTYRPPNAVDWAALLVWAGMCLIGIACLIGLLWATGELG